MCLHVNKWINFNCFSFCLERQILKKYFLLTASKKLDVNPKKPRGKKSSKTAAKVALMKMKLHAVGDTKIPDFDRVYLQVVLPGGAVSKGTTKPLFFSKVYGISGYFCVMFCLWILAWNVLNLLLCFEEIQARALIYFICKNVSNLCIFHYFDSLTNIVENGYRYMPNKRHMGHIANLRNQIKSINTFVLWLYHNVDLERRKPIISFL